MHLRRLLLLPALALPACSSETVRLFELREAPVDTPQAQAYARLEKAVALANEFLHTSPRAILFPAERATYRLSFTDILVEYQNEGIDAVRLETPGWADPRTVLGDSYHPTRTGFLTQRVSGGDEGADPSPDAGFLLLPHDEMAAVLLRQTTMQREIRMRGRFDYWINYDLLGLWPGNGWGEGNPVNRRAYAVEYAFREWLAERGSIEPSPEQPEAPQGEEERKPEDYLEPT